MPIILMISLLVSYLGIRSDAHIFLMIENRESFILSCILYTAMYVSLHCIKNDDIRNYKQSIL